MRFLTIATLIAAAVAQSYEYPGEDVARASAIANDVDVKGATNPSDINDVIHPKFARDVNYLRARASPYANGYTPGVYVCKGPGFKGDCLWQREQANVCFGLPVSDTLAVGPDIGLQCMFFSGENCSGDHTKGETVAPGVADFKGYQGLKGAPASYKCKPCDDKHVMCGGPWVGAGPW